MRIMVVSSWIKAGNVNLEFLRSFMISPPMSKIFAVQTSRHPVPGTVLGGSKVLVATVGCQLGTVGFHISTWSALVVSTAQGFDPDSATALMEPRNTLLRTLPSPPQDSSNQHALYLPKTAIHIYIYILIYYRYMLETYPTYTVIICNSNNIWIYLEDSCLPPLRNFRMSKILRVSRLVRSLLSLAATIHHHWTTALHKRWKTPSLAGYLEPLIQQLSRFALVN